MSKPFLLIASICALALSSQSAFAADPTIKEVHAAAASGHVDQALTMMDQVLKDHPNSAKAHYVEAELYARAHRLSEARGELVTSEKLAPGLPFAKPAAVSALKQELSASETRSFAPRAVPSERRPGIPWGMIIVIGLVLFGLFAFFRRRQQTYVTPMGGSGGWNTQPGYGPQPGPWSAPGGGGMGSGILGGLASGAAMGAGFAAGEAVVDHMFGGERRQQPFAGDAFQGGSDSNANQDMGGDDFGISDDSSWDDGNSGGGDGW